MWPIFFMSEQKSEKNLETEPVGSGEQQFVSGSRLASSFELSV